ncbi:ATP-binding protein [Actibacterium ureilyticum]|uniref:ATP-binding protein n=1 Tax=Actibacterium ureilyticum TaxID=1590614 RepID=UPI000BAB08B0|nr:ATP-binding protein [Actibacterium ureilyticum]
MTPDDLKALLTALPMPIVVIDSTERVVAMNTAAGEMFGTAGEGRHYVTVLRQPEILDCVEECLRLRQSRNLRYLTSAMTRELTFDVTARPCTLSDWDGVVLSFDDISDRQQAGQIRRDFVANVSHELKTPLTALLGFIETLKGPARNDAGARDRFLSIMEREAFRMDRLVRDLLSLSRVESEERIRPDQRIDVVGLVQSSIQPLLPLARESGISVDVTGDLAPCEVRGDADQLTQIFTNLVENAIKYGPRGTSVTIRITRSERELAFRGPGITIDVIDDGDGIDPVHIPRLTERFYRVDSHRSREMGGTGLGLAIVKHIVNRHRGRFRIESAKGQGSRFSVMLPVA